MVAIAGRCPSGTGRGSATLHPRATPFIAAPWGGDPRARSSIYLATTMTTLGLSTHPGCVLMWPLNVGPLCVRMVHPDYPLLSPCSPFYCRTLIGLPIYFSPTLFDFHLAGISPVMLELHHAGVSPVPF